MGGHLSQPNKLLFNQWWRDTFTNEPGLTLPPDGLIWDYYPKPGTCDFIQCPTTPSLLTSSPDSFNAECIPPFVSTARGRAVVNLVHQLVNQGHHVLLVGDPGSGKTSLLQQMFGYSGICSGITPQHFYASQVLLQQCACTCACSSMP